MMVKAMPSKTNMYSDSSFGSEVSCILEPGSAISASTKRAAAFMEKAMDPLNWRFLSIGFVSLIHTADGKEIALEVDCNMGI